MPKCDRWKRTMPFQKECEVFFETVDEMGSRCLSGADFGLYFGVGERIFTINLCKFHTIEQELFLKNQRGL